MVRAAPLPHRLGVLKCEEDLRAFQDALGRAADHLQRLCPLRSTDELSEHEGYNFGHVALIQNRRKEEKHIFKSSNK